MDSENVLIEINQLRKDMESIKEQLNRLENICVSIKLSCDKVDTTSDKMVSHINLVETVYSSVRSPLEFIRKRLTTVSGSSKTNELPMIL